MKKGLMRMHELFLIPPIAVAIEIIEASKNQKQYE